MFVLFTLSSIRIKMEHITSFPTFTIPTFRCCSLILPFDDIKEILGSPHIVQVGIGELSKSEYQIDLRINWLHSPSGWPVLASGFNPGNPSEPQVYQFELAKKQIQISNGPSRTWLSYEDMIALVTKATTPGVSMISLPCEQGEEAPQPKKLRPDGSLEKLKRKANRQHESFMASLEAVRKLDGKFQIILPKSSHDVADIENVVGLTA